MKTPEELKALRNEFAALNKKLLERIKDQTEIPDDLKEEVEALNKKVLERIKGQTERLDDLKGEVKSLNRKLLERIKGQTGIPDDLKEEVETLNKKLADLTEEELTQVSGGINDIKGRISVLQVALHEKMDKVLLAYVERLYINSDYDYFTVTRILGDLVRHNEIDQSIYDTIIDILFSEDFDYSNPIKYL